MAQANEFYKGIREALLGGVEALHKGEPLTRREAVVVSSPPQMTPEEVIRLRRRRLKVSQHVFARLLNVAPATVQAWEQGRNVATGATLRLLRLAEKQPSILLDMVSVRPIATRAGRRPRRLRPSVHAR